MRDPTTREGDARQPLCADIDGFSLHAAVWVESHDRKQLEQLCSDITRPALADERIQINTAGQVELKLKTPWRNGNTHLVMSPLEFMQRVAALILRPRLHLVRFHGMLAPNAKLRALAVPQGPPAQQKLATEAAAAAGCEVEPVLARPNRIGWARLLKRVFDIDMQHCPNCGGGELKIIAAILERPVIEKTFYAPGDGSAAATPGPSAGGGARLKRRLSRAVRRGLHPPRPAAHSRTCTTSWDINKLPLAGAIGRNFRAAAKESNWPSRANESRRSVAVKPPVADASRQEFRAGPEGLQLAGQSLSTCRAEGRQFITSAMLRASLAGDSHTVSS